MSPFKLFLVKPILVIAIMSLALSASANNQKRAAKQAELDAACEAAREERLIPLRKKMVSLCVDNKEFGSAQECEAYYADYGERAGGRAAMFYDLPACVEAFNYAQSERAGE